MTQEELVSLINSDIDGTINPEQSAELNARLALDTGSRKLHQELKNLSALLSRLDPVNPPLELHKQIINAIQFEGPSAHRSLLRGRSFFRSLFVRPGINYTYAFAMGIVVGIVALSLFGTPAGAPETIDPNALYGTISSSLSPSNFRTGDYREIRASGVDGLVRTVFSPEIILADVRINSESEVRLLLDFDRNDLNFTTFRRMNSESNQLSVSPRGLTITSKGFNKYLIAFDRKSANVSSIAIRLESNGEVVFADAVTPEIVAKH
jgi:hypothetical protein